MFLPNAAHATEHWRHGIQLQLDACLQSESVEVRRMVPIELHAPLVDSAPGDPPAPPRLDSAPRYARAPSRLDSVPSTNDALQVHVTCVARGVSIATGEGGRMLLTREVTLTSEEARSRPRILALAIVETVAITEQLLGGTTREAPPARGGSSVRSEPSAQGASFLGGRDGIGPAAVSSSMAEQPSPFGWGGGIGVRAWSSSGLVQASLAARLQWNLGSRVALVAAVGGAQGSVAESLGKVRARDVCVHTGVDLHWSGRERGLGLRAGAYLLGGIGQVTGTPTTGELARGSSVTGALGGVALSAGVAVPLGKALAATTRAHAGMGLLGVRGTVDGSDHGYWEGPWWGASVEIGSWL